MASDNIEETYSWLRAAGFMKGPIAMDLQNTFATWDAVVSAATAGAQLWYHAPMDIRATRVCVRKVFKNGKIRIESCVGDGLIFTVDSGHLNRFRTRGV